MKPHLKLILLSCLVMSGAWINGAVAQDSMADFGLNVAELEPNLVNAIVTGSVPAYPDKKLFKSAPPALQSALVQNVLIWFKTYTESEAFKADYLKQRDVAKPSKPEPASADDKYAAYLAEQRQGLEKMKRDVAQMTPDMQKQMKVVLEQMEAEFEKTAKDQNMTALMKQGFEQENVFAQQTYQEHLAAWEKQYPENPKKLIAARLHEFMELSKDIDFDAKLVPDAEGKLMKFSDPGYEARSRKWKLCYRAGREPVQAARAFVGEWLNQIEKQ